MTDAQVNDCAERLSQLGVPVNGSTNPKIGYIKNRMCCDACVYGDNSVHVQECAVVAHGLAEAARIKKAAEEYMPPRIAKRYRLDHEVMREALQSADFAKGDAETKRIAGEYDKLFRNPPSATSACERCVYGSGEHAEWCEQHPEWYINYGCAVGHGFIRVSIDEAIESQARGVACSLVEDELLPRLKLHRDCFAMIWPPIGDKHEP